MTNPIIRHVIQGDFSAASAIARERDLPIHTELARIAEFLSTTVWLAEQAPDPSVRKAAPRVLQAVASISDLWVGEECPAPEPVWRPRAAALATRPVVLRQEMLLALPRR
ncbi:hypothetical protein [Thalassobaculum salexigens]|uniref:hypothetical protein n=1 Tax=Thalassobaculum salexigens TaxID=455360 RepID=UPI00048DB160|nr:hypothetical protein [Thalassobaculum salexigens]